MTELIAFLRDCGTRGLSFSLGDDGGVVIGHDVDDLDNETLAQIRGRRHAIREVLVSLQERRVSRAEIEAIAIVRGCSGRDRPSSIRRRAKANSNGRKSLNRDAAA